MIDTNLLMRDCILLLEMGNHGKMFRHLLFLRMGYKGRDSAFLVSLVSQVSRLSDNLLQR